MKDNSLDNIFHQRMGNYESKVAFDNDLLWSKINKQIIPLEKSKPFYQKHTFYYFIGCTITIITILSVLKFYKNSISSKSPLIKLENQEPNHPKLEKSVKQDTFILKNKSIQRINTIDKKILTSGLNKNIQQKSVSNNNSIDSLPFLKSTENTNQITETKSEEPSAILQTIEEPKNQHVLKKITVVKRHIVEKDSVVTTKRLRKH